MGIRAQLRGLRAPYFETECQKQFLNISIVLVGKIHPKLICHTTWLYQLSPKSPELHQKCVKKSKNCPHKRKKTIFSKNFKVFIFVCSKDISTQISHSYIKKLRPGAQELVFSNTYIRKITKNAHKIVKNENYQNLKKSLS